MILFLSGSHQCLVKEILLTFETPLLTFVTFHCAGSTSLFLLLLCGFSSLRSSFMLISSLRFSRSQGKSFLDRGNRESNVRRAIKRTLKER